MAAGQQVRGIVHDSASGQPVPAAVVVLVTGAGATVERSITDGDGRFVFNSAGAATRANVIRIGFRPRYTTLPPARQQVMFLDVSLAQLPTMLDTVRVVTAGNCPKGRDAAAAASLLEQERDGVLAAVVSNEARPASMFRLVYERKLDDAGRILSQRVHSLTNRSLDSFRAVYTARQFVRNGFAEDSAGYRLFFAPDARTVVDPEFAAGYCFGLSSDHTRPGQVGLTFSPSKANSGLIDITGTLWADTAKRELRSLEFSYLGLDTLTRRVGPGGFIGFRSLPNGVVFVDDWSLRLPVLERDTLPDMSNNYHVRQVFHAQESGGRVASARWPDFFWTSSLGTLDVRAVHADGRPVIGAAGALRNTDYAARTDSSGRLVIKQLLPGPYELTIVDSAFSDLAISLDPVLRFVATADSAVHADVVVNQPIASVVSAFCPHGLHGSTSSVLVGRLRDSFGNLLAGGSVTAEWTPTGAVGGGGADATNLRAQVTANAAGVFVFCGLPESTLVEFSATRAGASSRMVGIATPASRRLLRLDLTTRAQ